MLVVIVGIKLEFAQIIRKASACVYSITSYKYKVTYSKLVKFSDDIQSLRVKCP